MSEGRPSPARVLVLPLLLIRTGGMVLSCLLLDNCWEDRSRTLLDVATGEADGSSGLDQPLCRLHHGACTWSCLRGCPVSSSRSIRSFRRCLGQRSSHTCRSYPFPIPLGSQSGETDSSRANPVSRARRTALVRVRPLGLDGRLSG